MVNKTSKPLTVYKASAGSGKTFTLAAEYIRLVVENPLSYRNILAVTFTNKATEEMKMRILSQLYGIWKQLPESKAYLDIICEKTGMAQKMVSERAGMALTNLLHNYNYFRVMTIDTFFQSVLRNLARELDLTANLRIGLNDVQVEELAVDRLIEQLTHTDVLLQWLMRYIMENISDDKGWNVIGQIKQFGKTIFRDEYKAVSAQLSQKLAEPGFFDSYTSRLKEIRQAAADRMRQIADQFFETLESEGLSIEDIPYGRAGVCGLFLKLREGVFDEGIVGKRATDCLGDPTKWYKKTHPMRETIHILAESTLDSLLRQAIDERPRQWRLYKSADLTLRHLNQLRLLGSIEQKVRELNETANRFLLSDTQQLLHALIEGSDSPFIFEKIGTQLEHVMIDEFQDTSTVQWQNFKVLLGETMSHEQTSNLIVGDVKQSIYRWRSGDWRLLNDIESQFPSPASQLDILPLATNWRSQRHIIEFNNAFFQAAAELEYLGLGGSSDAEQLRRAYVDVVQDIPQKRMPEGLVNIRLLPQDDYQTATLEAVVDTVRELTGQGVHPGDIAILVRTNAYIPLIAEHFMQSMPEVSIVSDEAFRLDASVAVSILIGALQVLTHPTDRIAKAAVAKMYQRQVLHNNALDSELLIKTKDLDALLPTAFVSDMNALLAMPLYDLVERLYTLFSIELLDGQSAYVCAFFDRLADYITESGANIEAFLAEWEESLCGKTIQSDEVSGIRLISIHKSKGLEFDHVIIPFCDWQLEKSQGNVLWCQPQEAPFNDLPIVPVDYSQKQMNGTIYENDYHREHLQTTVDNLNLLYVAFTRASRNLFVFGRRGAKNSRSALLEICLPQISDSLEGSVLDGLEDEKGLLAFSYGSLSVRPAEKDSKQSASQQNVFMQESEPLPIHIDTFENKVEFRQSNRSKDFTAGDDEQAGTSYIQLGSVLHQIFSTIRTTADIEPALRQLQLEGILYDEQMTAERITSMLHKRLSDPRVASWFSDRWTLYNECTILSLHDGQVLERRPDRVLTDGKEWIVIDFKFGSPKPEHTDQVKAYMSLISRLPNFGHAALHGYLWYVYSNKIVEVNP